MLRETQRRLILLAVVAVVAAAWVTAFDTTGVTPVATAAAVKPSPIAVLHPVSYAPQIPVVAAGEAIELKPLALSMPDAWRD